MTPAMPRRTPSSSARNALLIGIFLILLTAALRLGAGLLIPIAIAILFALLLDQPVRALGKLGISNAIGAALLVFGSLGALITGGALLAGPAAEWIEKVPATFAETRAKLGRIIRPIQEAARKVEEAAGPAAPQQPPTGQPQGPSLLHRVTGGTLSAVGTLLTVVFLTYFLLVGLPSFRKKLAHMIGTRSGVQSMETLLTEIETQMSRYLLLNALTSIAVGAAAWVLLIAIGLPNALLWGFAAGLLNFVPYLGALVTVGLVGMAALTSFDDMGRVLLAVGGIGAINLLEGNLLTPHLLGKNLPLNPVAIFVGLLYWGWVWGPLGVLVAVPITVMLQLIFSRVESLQPVSVLLDS